MNVADAPSEIKTMEKPIMKNKTFKRMRFRTAVLSAEVCISSKLTPEIKDKYPGTIGRTQGEMKDIKPAVNAARIPTFSTK